MKEEDEYKSNQNEEQIGEATDRTSEKSQLQMGLSIDFELYEQLLEDSDLSEEQKREYIETLWSIVVSFVDLGFNIHPVQQVCEQNAEISDFIASEVETMLNSDDNSNDQLNDTNDRQSGPSLERSPK